MSQTVEILLSPSDHGRRMTLAEFDRAEGAPGHLYELSKGIVNVMDVPSLPHAAQFEELRDQLILYRKQKPGRIKHVLGTGESKVLLEKLESERHPDIAVYRHPPDDPGNWAAWV